MVVDTSVVVAILLGEPDADLWARRMASSGELVMSAASYLELGMVTFARRKLERDELDRRLAAANIAVVPVSPTQAILALEAFYRYGKGQDPAKLNFGDCLTYALAKERRDPLLFKGDDFSQTDITHAS
jgi:ribonuclease VapC